MPDIVNLSCPSCGAKPNITYEKERFVRVHRSREHAVKRVGGFVLLSADVGALQKAVVGIDQTASEIGTNRIQREREQPHSQGAALIVSSPKPQINADLHLLISADILVAIVSHSTSNAWEPIL
jgi:hypothetical protein